jgi:hypothetical protein
LTRLVIGLSAVEKPWRRIDTRLRVVEGLLAEQRVETRHGPLIFVTTHPQALQYPREFATREPETLAWIDAFETPCRFWDIGANIGVFSIYAGLNAGSVFNAFESSDDCFGNEIAVVFRQGTVGFSIDGFRRLFGLAAPNYLKIDVDSIEERILAGACETLRNPDLRSVLIELEAADTSRNDRLTDALSGAGFRLALRSTTKQGGVVNGIFERTAAYAVAEPSGEPAAP